MNTFVAVEKARYRMHAPPGCGWSIVAIFTAGLLYYTPCSRALTGLPAQLRTKSFEKWLRSMAVTKGTYRHESLLDAEEQGLRLRLS